jgi:hypothetical protein
MRSDRFVSADAIGEEVKGYHVGEMVADAADVLGLRLIIVKASTASEVDAPLQSEGRTFERAC